MKVKDLIELNAMITDLEITVRLNGNLLLDQLNIGPSEGVIPPYPTRGTERCKVRRKHLPD